MKKLHHKSGEVLLVLILFKLVAVIIIASILAYIFIK